MARSRGGRRWSTLEQDLRDAGHTVVAGVDEVGRGPLAGPVVACAIVMPTGARAIPGINDSKQLAPAERDRLARLIRARAVSIGIGAASVREIDRINIYHATVLAMRRAVARIRPAPDHLIVDGLPIATLGHAHTAVVKGDATCYTIACASIVAKVVRDRLMTSLAARYPAYSWERNAGYGTAAHLAAIAEVGGTRHHRMSFKPFAQGSLFETVDRTKSR
jgi:ribonuclease HII